MCCPNRLFRYHYKNLLPQYVYGNYYTECFGFAFHFELIDKVLQLYHIWEYLLKHKAVRS